MFKVEFDGTPATRSLYVAALVASSTKSKKKALGDSGYQVTTEHVKDVANLAGTPDEPVGDHTLTGFCTLDGISAFELAPPRGKRFRVAIALFTRVEDDNANTLLLTALQHIEPDAVENAVACVRRLRRLTEHIRPTSEHKRSHTVAALTQPSAESAPKVARTLQRCGTGASLPDKRAQ